MKRSPILFTLFLALTAASLTAAEPLKFREPREAIAAAKQTDRLIFFLLIEGFEEASQKVEAAMVEAVKKQDGDFFVLGICQHRNLSHRAMFEQRFGKDVSKAPVAVISDAEGNELTGCYGQDPETYVNMLRFARLKAGKFADREEEERLKQQLADEEIIGDTIFGLTRSMIEPARVFLTPERIWTFKNGDTMKAALLTAEGTNGTFIKEDGSEAVVDFNLLTGREIVYLQQVLRQ